jgi:hypothetical protein
MVTSLALAGCARACGRARCLSAACVWRGDVVPSCAWVAPADVVRTAAVPEGPAEGPDAVASPVGLMVTVAGGEPAGDRLSPAPDGGLGGVVATGVVGASGAEGLGCETLTLGGDVLTVTLGEEPPSPDTDTPMLGVDALTFGEDTLSPATDTPTLGTVTPMLGTETPMLATAALAPEAPVVGALGWPLARPGASSSATGHTSNARRAVAVARALRSLVVSRCMRIATYPVAQTRSLVRRMVVRPDVPNTSTASVSMLISTNPRPCSQVGLAVATGAVKVP